MKDKSELIARYKELTKLKRRLLEGMKKHRRYLAKAKATKKSVNDEMAQLRRSGNVFGTMTMSEVKEHVQNEIKAVKPEDIYPKDLEREFDRLERNSIVNMRKDPIDIDDNDDVQVKPSHAKFDDDEGAVVSVDEDAGVLDMSSEDPSDVIEAD